VTAPKREASRCRAHRSRRKIVVEFPQFMAQLWRLVRDEAGDKCSGGKRGYIGSQPKGKTEIPVNPSPKYLGETTC
jgi:hypothetical protein